MTRIDEALVSAVCELSREAGRATLKFYGGNVSVERKADDSPLTAADKASHTLILETLRKLTPGIPVLSEESSETEVAERRKWDTFWLVDPLDGTKEFIKGTGEFTVNIALVSGTGPVLGVVHIPVSGVTYWGRKGVGAFKAEAGKAPVAIHTRPANLEKLVIVASKDHAGPQVEALLKRLTTASTANMGSSLKFCLVAEGKADFYPRLQPTCEWDTGAAQCVLEAAGGAVTDTEGRPLAYNKEQLTNPSFLAFGDPRQDWRALLEGR
ncbi:3'(2'),5'-bisphosphate nucleotidase CysQ [Vitiosangium sp. GDMCC 1.1324]|uniref:3'(2'),5'-bisphosphate nucleotidase CysQ n=1 Tax=Vitiosangium sp. (strain GDMCC 1.1324) TaxID=2138576 RepID=UPI000D35844A|nr:3'(2'),5'-bisphosphate nucleotidase CysQ [Vitiosangium sp. GDMCC 1.1324]PTL74979.1 3'(2'),5'-bisphosphate nucleotidase [Vitiosangium sp. GDMCC 1.1324]